MHNRLHEPSEVKAKTSATRETRGGEFFFVFFFHFFSSPRLALRTHFALHAKCHVHLPWLIKHLLYRLMKVYLRKLSIFAGNLWDHRLGNIVRSETQPRHFYFLMSCDLEVTSESAYCWRKNKLNNNLLPLLNVAQALIECRQTTVLFMSDLKKCQIWN